MYVLTIQRDVTSMRGFMSTVMYTATCFIRQTLSQLSLTSPEATVCLMNMHVGIGCDYCIGILYRYTYKSLHTFISSFAKYM
jgi:predicted RND superfamily exporter protein